MLVAKGLGSLGLSHMHALLRLLRLALLHATEHVAIGVGSLGHSPIRMKSNNNAYLRAYARNREA
jgi:hypothetical protein